MHLGGRCYCAGRGNYTEFLSEDKIHCLQIKRSQEKFSLALASDWLWMIVSARSVLPCLVCNVVTFIQQLDP